MNVETVRLFRFWTFVVFFLHCIFGLMAFTTGQDTLIANFMAFAKSLV